MSTEYVETTAGDRIAYDREGHGGRPLVLVGGAGQFRAVDESTRTVTTLLAGHGFDVIHHDRPGRGESTGVHPLTLEGEVAAIAALIDVLGGRAAVYGSSSGGAIALAAAGRLPAVDRLVLWEVPLSAEGGEDAAAFLSEMEALLDAGDAEGAWRHFMDGLPPEWFEGMRHGPHWPLFERAAPSLRADAEALAWTQSAPYTTLWSGVTVPTTVVTGSSAFGFMVEAADALVAALPDARRAEVPATEGHTWTPVDLATVVAEHAR